MSDKIRVLVNNNHDYASGYDFCDMLDDITIENDLKTFQGIVGGLIEPVTICNFYIGKKQYAIDLICNDEGKLLNLDKTAVVMFDRNAMVYDIICGNFIVSVCDRSKGDYIDMSDDVYNAIVNAFQVVQLSNDKETLLLPTFEPDAFIKSLRVLSFV